MNLAALILGLLSLIYGFFSARDYVRGGNNLSPSARVWLRISIIFAAVSVILLLAP